jgi:hypothetical protein
MYLGVKLEQIPLTKKKKTVKIINEYKILLIS